MAKAPLPTPAMLRQLLDYDPTTGLLTWRYRTPEALMACGLSVPSNLDQWNTRLAGKVAFTADNGRGYRITTAFGQMLRAHRVAWAMHYDAWPDAMLDHINGDRADNRIANLRLSNFVENGRNARISVANKSGQTGVVWVKRISKWRAKITVNSKRIELGEFDLYRDAVRARKNAEKVHGFSPNHGRAR